MTEGPLRVGKSGIFQIFTHSLSLFKRLLPDAKYLFLFSFGDKLCRYNVHEKIVNFMAPQHMDLPPMAPVLFENLFGLKS